MAPPPPKLVTVIARPKWEVGGASWGWWPLGEKSGGGVGAAKWKVADGTPPGPVLPPVIGWNNIPVGPAPRTNKWECFINSTGTKTNTAVVLPLACQAVFQGSRQPSFNCLQYHVIRSNIAQCSLRN